MKAAHYWRLGSTLLLTVGVACPIKAQVIPDGSVGTIVSAVGSQYSINNGTQVGSNLFHSFSQFSVPTGGAARFNNALTVQTIFARVTGGNVSNIDGLLQTNGSASLFLLNPAGILFGAHASLNLGGSFVATTANSIKFADGTEFNATQITGMPLLTISVPIGLQMGQNPGAIVVQGAGHRLAQPSFYYPIIQPIAPVGLSVSAGSTLALIGSTIALEGGVLLAPSGHIELGSLSSGNVDIRTGSAPWAFDYSNVQQFADIRLSQQALVDASGAPAGSLHLQGRNISFLEGSVARLQNLGGAALGDLVINASGLLEMRQVGTAGFQNNLLSAENLGSGASGNLIISAQQLQVQDGGVITTKTFTAALGGNLKHCCSRLTLFSCRWRWSTIAPTVTTASRLGCNISVSGTASS